MGLAPPPLGVVDEVDGETTHVEVDFGLGSCGGGGGGGGSGVGRHGPWFRGFGDHLQAPTPLGGGGLDENPNDLDR